MYSIPSDITLQSIFIAPTSNDESFLFRCYHCGTSIARIKGEVKGIISGFIPMEIPVISQCLQCKENYTFIPISHNNEAIELSISPELNKQFSTFMCVKCRSPIFRYDLDKIFLSLNLRKICMPQEIQCDCGMDYLLKEIVSKSDII
jgi:uncharacterized protein with PIN domain